MVVNSCGQIGETEAQHLCKGERPDCGTQTPRRKCTFLLPFSVHLRNQRMELAARTRSSEKQQALGEGISHLDALIDTAHYPVEEAAVDILSQGIPSILSLGCGAQSH